MNQTKSNIIIGAVMVLLAALLKIATYYNEFSMTPIIAIALFSGAVITDKKLAFLIPVLAMFAADCLMEVFKVGYGFYGMEQLGNYGALLFITVFGFAMKKINLVSIAGFSISATLLFYFLSNSNTFLFDSFNMYENTVAGYTKCMVAGLPFLKARLLTDLLWSGVLFGSYVLYFKSYNKKAIA